MSVSRLAEGRTNFLASLEKSARESGLSAEAWGRFVDDLGQFGRVTAVWSGVMTEGEFVLRAWQKEARIPRERVASLAKGLCDILQTQADTQHQVSLGLLYWCRGAEKEWGAPVATRTERAPFVTAQSLGKLFDHYLEGGLRLSPLPSGERKRILANLQRRLDEAKPGEDGEVLHLARPLGVRTGSVSPFNGEIFYKERVEMVWAAIEAEAAIYTSLDELRDFLGLVQYHDTDYLVVFSYTLPYGERARVPTAIEALGGWAWWPADSEDGQRTVNYRTGALGVREFVHGAVVPPESMRVVKKGPLSRNWDDESAAQS